MAGIFGAIEAGGTKFVCAVGCAGSVVERTQFATGDRPEVVLAQVVEWLRERERTWGRLAALGVASFGPVELDERSPKYGFITTTPKRGWAHTDVLGPLRRAFEGRPIGFDTDVNGAALGEGRYGAARGLEDFVYVTAGTGIGGGAMARGRLLHGLLHPEMGHILMPVLDGDTFEGVCPYHGRCWEGLCSGPAIERRTGRAAEELAPDDPVWELTARYMAHAFVTLSCVLSPRRIILGGGVRKGGKLGEAAFFDAMRRHYRAVLAGYIAAPELDPERISGFLVSPELGDNAGVCGALALAEDAWAVQRA